MTTNTVDLATNLRDHLFDRAEKREDEGYQNGADGSRAWAEAVDALLKEREGLLTALRFYAAAEAYEVDADRGSIASKALKAVGEL